MSSANQPAAIGQDHPINGFSVFTLIVFFGVISRAGKRLLIRTRIVDAHPHVGGGSERSEGDLTGDRDDSYASAAPGSQHSISANGQSAARIEERNGTEPTLKHRGTTDTLRSSAGTLEHQRQTQRQNETLEHQKQNGTGPRLAQTESGDIGDRSIAKDDEDEVILSSPVDKVDGHVPVLGEGREGDMDSRRQTLEASSRPSTTTTAPLIRRRSTNLSAARDNTSASIRSDGNSVATTASNQGSKDSDEERMHFTLGLATAPVIGVLLLLATTSVGGQTLRDGIVGAGGVKPYDIMTLFISLAYISLSLDCTGLLRFLAFWVATKGGRSGRRMYLFFYLFFFTFGVFVGNDPIILSGTSFLAYFSKIAGISPPRAWTFAQFAAANVASAVLVSSNPTNLVLTGAYGISFLVYSAWLVLPVIATAVCLFPLLLYVQFNDDELIPRSIEPPGVDPRAALIDRRGAIFGSVLLGITLAALVGLSAGGLLHGVEGVWTVTAPAAIVMVCRDLYHDRHSSSNTAPSADVTSAEKFEQQGMDDLSGMPGVAERGGDQMEMEEIPRDASGGNGEANRSKASTESKQIVPTQQTGSKSHPSSLQSTFRRISHRFPTFAHVFVRLPLPLLPFAFSMFILVEALQYVGWMRIFGGWWSAWVKVGGVAGAVFLMGLLSVIGCNIFGTNIGATILLSRVLQQWSQNSGEPVSQRILYGSVFTLALGSNYGALSFTFSASLAGLLWKTILAQKSIHVGRAEFARNNVLAVVVCMIVGCLVIAGEVCVIYKD